MFEKLAEDIYYATLFKIDQMAKLAGQRANKKLLQAMTRVRKGKAPSYGEFIDRVVDTREKGIGYTNERAKVYNRGGYRSSYVTPFDIKDELKNIDDIVQKDPNLSPVQSKHLKYLRSKLPMTEIEKDPVKEFSKLPEDVASKYNQAIKKYIEYYRNITDPLHMRREIDLDHLDFRNGELSTQEHILKKLRHNPYTSDKGGKDLIRSIEANPELYDFMAHRETIKNDADLMKIYKNTREQLRSKANSNIMPELRAADLELRVADPKSVQGMSLQKAIDTYGGGMENALFRGGDTDGITQPLHAEKGDRTIGNVLSVREGPFPTMSSRNPNYTAEKPLRGAVNGMESSEVNMGQLPAGKGTGDYYGDNDKMIFLSGIPQIGVGYALGGKGNTSSAIPFSIGNLKRIRELNHTLAKNNAVAQGKNYNADSIDRITDTHPHWATTNLEDIDYRQAHSRFDLSNVHGGSSRMSNSPSLSPYYETQVPGVVLNTPGAYERGAIVGRDGINSKSLGDAESINAIGSPGVNEYKNLLQQVMNEPDFDKNYAFFPADELKKLAPISDVTNAFSKRRDSLEDALEIISTNRYHNNNRKLIRGIDLPGMSREFLENDRNSPIYRRYYDRYGLEKYKNGWGALLDDATIYR